MAKPTWRIGAFAERSPSPARDIGRTHKLELVANRLLYATAGVAEPRALLDSCYGGSIAGPDGTVRGCCGAAPCPGAVDSACARGTCVCGLEADGFEDIYPDAVRALANSHAFGAALRDILTDPDVDDVAEAISTALSLYEGGKLAALYAPAVPAKKMPDGSDAPARCPICGAVVCATCQHPCACGLGAVSKS